MENQIQYYISKSQEFKKVNLFFLLPIADAQRKSIAIIN